MATSADAGRIADLGVGQPDFPTPEHIKQAAYQAIAEDFTKYTPQPGFLDLREAVADTFRRENGFTVSAEQVVVSCGAKHSLYNIMQCALSAGDEVLIPTPCWFCYPHQVEMAGGVPVLLPTRQEDGFQPDVAQLRKAVTVKTRMLVLNSPTNPTGAVFTRETLAHVAELACELDLLVVADEVYEKILFGANTHVSLASLGPEVAARTITVNSVSKTHAMTGWRIGYAALPRQLAERVTLLQANSTSGPAAPSQRAALAALRGDQSHVATMVESYAQRREYLLKRLTELPELSCLSPQGTFYMFLDVSALLGRNVGSHVQTDVDKLSQLLLKEAGVRVTSGRSFGSERHVRMSFAAAQADLELGMDRLSAWLSS